MFRVRSWNQEPGTRNQEPGTQEPGTWNLEPGTTENSERHMIVMKFGGTSVADVAAIERLMSIVRAARQAAIQPENSDWRGPIVVVSALGGATDRLLGIAAEA